MCIPFAIATYKLLNKLDNKTALFKATIVLIFCETTRWVALCVSFTGYKTSQYSIELFSFILLFNFEIPMIKNKILFNLNLVKHIFMWHYHDIMRTDLSYLCSEPLSILAFSFIIANMGHDYRLKTSYERFKAMKEIEIRDKKFQIITDAYNDGILILGVSMEILFNNDMLCKLLRCSPDKLKLVLGDLEYSSGKKTNSYQESNKISQDLIYLGNRDLESNQEITIGVNTIENVTMEWKCRQITWEDNKALFVSVKNVTSIVELEKSIANDQMKTVILRSVSHELRTPLNAIAFFTNELIEESENLNESEKNKLNIVKISSKLVLSLIDDLLDYSKMLAGVFKIQKSPSDIRSIVFNTLDLIKFQAEKKQIAINYRLDSTIPNLVETDALRFSQILLNLLSNALKFTIKGSIEVCLVMSGNETLKVYVQDTGVGMPDEIKGKLFSEFNTSNANNINPSGSGLGLCISNILAKELGNKPIKVKSKLDEGSTFKFSIKATNGDSVVEEFDIIECLENEITMPIDINPYRSSRNCAVSELLIVDDNEFNRVILGTILSKIGINFSEVCSGKSAINEILKQDSNGKPYKIVIMDCNMPDLDGWETTRRVKKLFLDGKLSCNPNIIGYSAFTSDEDKQMCFDSGMVEHLVKPSSPEKIIQTIKRFSNI